ncbi:hypothetical protein PL11201_690036 [Planktothrix sp. PCC 11201]|nr:hypothetical protein PL11201_690036 [Planktothrix sp. PCC 11201]
MSVWFPSPCGEKIETNTYKLFLDDERDPPNGFRPLAGKR